MKIKATHAQEEAKRNGGKKERDLKVKGRESVHIFFFLYNTKKTSKTRQVFFLSLRGKLSPSLTHCVAAAAASAGAPTTVDSSTSTEISHLLFLKERSERRAKGKKG